MPPAGQRPKGLGMVSCVGTEYVGFKKPLPLENKVGTQQPQQPGHHQLGADFAVPCSRHDLPELALQTPLHLQLRHIGLPGGTSLRCLHVLEAANLCCQRVQLALLLRTCCLTAAIGGSAARCSVADHCACATG